MKPTLLLLAGLATSWATAYAQGPAVAPAHVSNSFTFTIHAPLSKVAPLFGAERERVWAEGWDPQFVYPQPVEDKAGSVFRVRHGGQGSTWVTTIFEPDKGRIQYVYFVADAMVTLIDIHVVTPTPGECAVKVVYERTALSPEYNSHVQHMGESDAKSGPHWQDAIESYLKAKM
jgi:hypothetical protein